MFAIGKRNIGGDAPCFLTFEAGPTHHGFESAKRLVELAASSGADAVKFQFCDPDRLVADKKMLFTYDVLVDRETGETETIQESLHEILTRRVLSNDDYRGLKKRADELGIAFFATVVFEEDIAFAEELGFDSLKIASADVNHLPIIRKAAESGLSIQIDTGSATIGEVELAVDVIKRCGNEKIIIHHCPSGYPARLDGINLNVIKTLSNMFPYPIAYSDHSPGWEMDVAALALGAKLIEKTITEDRCTRSVEHVMSLEPNDMIKFVETVRNVEQAFGTPRRVMSPEELEKRRSVRRSVFAKVDIAKGEAISYDNVDFRRPGDGVTPDLFEQLVGGTAASGIVAGQKLQVGDFVLV